MSLPFRVLKIRKFFKRHRYDIIHSWHWSSDFTEPLAAKLAGIKFVYTKKAMGWGNKAWRWRSQLSTRIIAINSDMMSQFFSAMSHKTRQIPLGVDVEQYRPMDPSEELRHQLSISETDFVIVSVANLVPVKGIEVLLRAVNAIGNDNIKVLIIGNDQNEYAQDLKRTYENEQVSFLGKHNDVRPFIALANVFVIPTKDEGRREGMPIAPLEAMASGKIVLGSNISGVKDILTAFPDCIFEASNEEELASKIEGLIALSKEDRMELAKRMRTYVVENLSLKRCIENHEKFYEQLIN